MTEPLALYPIAKVLFPNMPLILFLHDPEEHKLIDNCTFWNQEIGVINILQAGKFPKLQQIGTRAKILNVMQIHSGTTCVMVMGTERFKVVQEIEGEIYKQAIVEIYPQQKSAPSAELIRQTEGKFHQYLNTILQEAFVGGTDLLSLPEDPEPFSYQIAESIILPSQIQQSLLEAQSSEKRIKMELALLKKEIALAEKQLYNISPAGSLFYFN
jgi:ATP-dependent Lon protease